MGIVYVEEGQPFVYEAIQPVRLTRLEDWERRGEGGHFVVKRLRDADRLLTAGNLSRMKAEGKKFQGRNYDLYFERSDDRMYCSELVWKIYYRALGIEIGRTQMLGDFDLSDPAVISEDERAVEGIDSVERNGHITGGDVRECSTDYRVFTLTWPGSLRSDAGVRKRGQS